MNKQRLFTASCISLIATAMSFAIRGDIMGEFETLFLLNKTNVGWIAGAAFWGFGLSIFIGGPLCDVLGMGTIMRLAAAGHIGGTLLTIFAPNFTILFLATVIIGIANGLVEAAINPLITAIYADQKTSRLTALHAWFPGGHRDWRRAGVPVHENRSGLAGEDAAAPGAVGHLHGDVSRTEVPADRARGGRRPFQRHVSRDSAAAVSADLGLHVPDGRNRARTGPVVRERLQRGDAELSARRHPGSSSG